MENIDRLERSNDELGQIRIADLSSPVFQLNDLSLWRNSSLSFTGFLVILLLIVDQFDNLLVGVVVVDENVTQTDCLTERYRCVSIATRQ